jgi:hypothetical protein
MTSADYVILGIGIVLFLGGLMALPWLCQWLIRLLHQSWRNSEGGGCSYNPLQEMIQPNIRHTVEVQQQRSGEDATGAPPNASLRRSDGSI